MQVSCFKHGSSLLWWMLQMSGVCAGQSILRGRCEKWGSPAAIDGHSHEMADKHSHADSQRSQDLHHQQSSSSGLVPMP